MKSCDHDGIGTQSWGRQTSSPLVEISVFIFMLCEYLHCYIIKSHLLLKLLHYPVPPFFYYSSCIHWGTKTDIESALVQEYKGEAATTSVYLYVVTSLPQGKWPLLTSVCLCMKRRRLFLQHFILLLAHWNAHLHKEEKTLLRFYSQINCILHTLDLFELFIVTCSRHNLIVVCTLHTVLHFAQAICTLEGLCRWFCTILQFCTADFLHISYTQYSYPGAFSNLFLHFALWYHHVS